MANVDTSIHDRTTGRAAQLAAKHASSSQSHPSTLPPQYLTLYGGWFCPFVQRVWLVLHEKNIPHQYIEINPYNKEAHFLALNPRGLVPTLAISDTNPDVIREQEQEQEPNGATTNGTKKEKEKVLYESTVVADYLDAIYPSSTSSTSSLYPTDPYNRAKHALWINHISTKIIPAFYRFLQHTPDKPYSLDSARDEFVKHLYTLFSELDFITPSSPLSMGKEIGMLDIALIPWACRIFLLDHYKQTSGIPEAGKAGSEQDEKVWERWRIWFSAVQSRESVKDTLSDRSRYVDVYKRYAEDTTGSQVGQATRGGRGLP